MKNVIRLPLENAYNVRELGGYAGKNAVTSWNRFLRGDDISTLTQNDIIYLKTYGVTSVLDLRSNYECELHPDALLNQEGITHYHMPFMVGKVDNIMDNVEKGIELKSFYLDLLRDQDKVKSIMSIIADAPEGCMLFHCAGGKDRTGVLSMLLLSLVEVDTEDIMTNYQVSYINLRRNKQMMGIELPKDFDMSCMYSQPETIEACVNYIYDNFGSTHKYLRNCGLTDTQIEKIKQKLLD